MKSSIYNIYKKGKNGYIVLNIRSSAAAHIDEETKCLLEENPNKIPSDILEMFLENDIVVEDNCDERKILSYYFNKDKYNVNLRDLAYTVVLTYACNLRCLYCYQGPEKDTEILNTKKVDILLKNIDRNLGKKDFKALWLNLYGGEPLLAYHECVQLMEGAFRICDEQNKEFEGGIVTNGVLINKKIIDNLLKPYCNSVHITMDGGREAHDKRRIHTDGSGTYDTLLHVLELLRDANINVVLRLNIDKENADTFIDLSRDLVEHGLGDIKKSLEWIRPPDTERTREGCASYAEKCFVSDEMVDFEDQIREQLGMKRVLGRSPVILKHSPCTFDREDIYVIDPYLNLYNCWEFIGKKDKKVGHISEGGETIFDCEYYDQMSRNPLEFEECKDCKYLPFCGGGCAAQAYVGNGTYHSPPCRTRTYSLKKYMSRHVDCIMEEMALSLSREET